jgi:hypothetical protein
VLQIFGELSTIFKSFIWLFTGLNAKNLKWLISTVVSLAGVKLATVFFYFTILGSSDS